MLYITLYKAWRIIGRVPIFEFMRETFYDSELQEAFARDGYALIRNLLPQPVLDEILAYYEANEQTDAYGFHVSNMAENAAQVQTHQKLVEWMLPEVNKYIKHYKPVLGCFAIKNPSNDSVKGIHQDWSFVDESRYDQLTVWLALKDVTLENGCVEFFKGSHNEFKNIRGQNIIPMIDYIHEELADKFTPVPVKAGDAVVLHSRVVHWSDNNRSGEPRIAAMLAMVPEEAKVMHFLRQDGDPFNRIEAFECPDDFYLHFDITTRPKEPSKGFITDTSNAANKQDALKLLGWN